MADPAEIVLAFLQRYQFVEAEAAFKAELCSRGDGGRFFSPSENVRNWDKQICCHDESALESSHEHMAMSVCEMEALRACNGGNTLGFANEEAKSPPEKQLYVEYEPAKLGPQDTPFAESDEFAFGGVPGLPDSEASMAPASSAGVSWVASFPQADRPTWGGTLPIENSTQKPSHGVVEDYVTKQQNQPYPDQAFQGSCCEKSILPCNMESSMHAKEALKDGARLKSACHTTESKASGSHLSPVRSGVGHSKEAVAQADKDEAELAIAKMSLDDEETQEDSITNDFFSLSFPEPDQITQQQGFVPGRTRLGNGNKSNELIWDGERAENLEKLWLQASRTEAPTQPQTHTENMDTSPNSVHECGELPRLPHVRLHFADSNMDTFNSKGLLDQNETVHKGFDSKALGCTEGRLAEDAFEGSRLIDWPLSQDLAASGSKRSLLRPSVSQGIVEALSEQRCGVVDGQHDRWSSDGYCDSDTYNDDDDPGYVRQPIADEEWFLAHEIDYPGDVERARQYPEKSRLPRTVAEDDRSYVDEESYFSGEEYYRSQAPKKPYPSKTDSSSFLEGDHDSGHVYGTEEPGMTSSQQVWKGFMGPPGVQDDTIFDGYKFPPSRMDGSNADDMHGSVKSGGVLVSSDVADIGSEVRDSLLGGSSEGGDAESLKGQEEVASPEMENFDAQEFLVDHEKPGKTESMDAKHDIVLQYYNEAWGLCQRTHERELASITVFKPKETLKSKESIQSLASNGGTMFEGFSFPSPSSTGDVPLSTAGSMKSLWSNRESLAQGDETDGYGSGMVGPDDTVAAWKRKSSDTSSPIVSGAGGDADLLKTCPPLNQEDEDALAGQEEMRTLGGDEDQYEIFNLRIIHRKNRTGFEEDKEFPVVLNSVVAGRYHVTEYLGSAAFSKAIQAHDLQTGIDVCMKIIKNNKDFFDQSLDEIKLLKFVNKHDPLDKYHILRLYDYFYHREHLFIVCELLRANLYEFHKFNRESGGEVYFTMPRLQSITRQCLEALEFLHRLGIIHCDLKPENILVKSYSRCEIKIIDLGSSCFQTDHLCSYVQSRSYRAPEVILGLPYDQKIDIWSLGCILAELCTGNVLFQNDSLATLLARVVGILGPIDPEVLAKGRDTHKYFTRNVKIYEKNQETDQLEYLLPKKTSLAHRLPMGDPGFIEFTRYLLQSNPAKRPTATEALQHAWLYYPYEPISS